MLNRQQKEVVVTSLQEGFSTSTASFVVNVKGLTVEKVEKLRKTLRANKAHLHVAKVRLMKRALMDGASQFELSQYMKEQIALVFAEDDALGIVKILCGFSKEAETFKVLAGYMDQQLLDEKAVKIMASLPSRDVMLAYFVGTLQAPMAEFVRVLKVMIALKSADSGAAVEAKDSE